MKLYQVDRVLVHEQVYNMLKEAILNGDIKPGEKMTQEELASRFGLSRMPIRDALRLLEIDKLVISIPNKGFVVAEFGKEELQDTFFLRSILEREAVKLAVPKLQGNMAEIKRLLENMNSHLTAKDFSGLTKLNSEFHYALYRESGSNRLFQMISSLWNSFPRYAMFSAMDQATRSQAEHQKIFEAIMAGDAELAGTLMERHILQAGAAYTLEV